MEWTEQMETMSQAWFDSQKKLWGSLYQATSATAPFGADNEFAQQWADFTKKSIETWTSNDNPAIKKTAQGFFMSQEATARFLELFQKSWQDVGAKVSNGQSWEQAIEEAMNKFRAQLDFPANAIKDSTELWQAFVGQWQGFAQPWVEAAAGAPTAFSKNGKSTSELVNLYQTAYDQTMGRFLDSPNVGITREMNQKVTDVFQVWQKRELANLEYQSAVANMTLKAVEKFMQRMAEMVQEGETIKTSREFVNLWVEIADPLFIDEFEAPEFVKAQAKYLNATMEYRMKQQVVTDMYLNAMGMPTLAQVDEANRNNYELRREIRALKRNVNTGDNADMSQLSTALSSAQDTIDVQKKEIAALKRARTASNKSQTEQAEQIANLTGIVSTLQQEIDALKANGGQA